MAKVYDRWYMFDATKDFFGTSEEYYFRMNDEAPAFEDIMIDAPETPTSGLCYSEFILYEDDDIEICRSHSIDEIYEHFNGGDYTIVLDVIDKKTEKEREFFISNINTNYNFLRIIGNGERKGNKVGALIYDTSIMILGDLIVNKDVEIRNTNIIAVKRPDMTWHDSPRIKVYSGRLIYSYGARLADYEGNVMGIFEQ